MARTPIPAAGFRDYDAIRARHSKPQLLVEGDSIPVDLFGLSSPSIPFWCGMNPRAYDYNPNTDLFAVGGSLSNTTGISTGLLHQSRIDRCVNRIKAIKESTGQAVVMVLNIGMNGDSNTMFADVKKWWGKMVEPGADQLIILPTQPSTGGWKLNPGQAEVRSQNNDRLRRWAAENAHEIQYANTTPHLLKNISNAADDVYPSLGDAGETVGSSTRDGTHACGYGAYLMSKEFNRCLANVTPPRPSRIASPYNGNLIGGQGRFNVGGAVASQMSSLVLKNNGALNGITNFLPGPTGISGTLAGVIATLTRVPYTPVQQVTGGENLTVLRMEFSGTTTEASNLFFGIDVNASWDPNVPIDIEADMYLKDLKNFRHLSVRGTAGEGIGLGSRAANSDNSDTIVVPVTGHFRPQSPYGFKGTSGLVSLGFNISWPAGVQVSGAIEFLGYGAFLAAPLPTATP